MNKPQRWLLGLLGLIATPVYWTFVLGSVLGEVMGDCFERPGHPCPSDVERNLWVIGLLICGTAVYGLLVVGWKTLDARLAGPSDPDASPPVQ